MLRFSLKFFFASGTVVMVAAAILVANATAATPAPSMSIDKVVAPTSVSGPNDAPTVPPTTWHVGLSGIGAWNWSACSSTAYYTDTSYGDTRADGKDATPNGPWNSWSFTAKTPGSWTFVPDPDTGDTRLGRWARRSGPFRAIPAGPD